METLVLTPAETAAIAELRTLNVPLERVFDEWKTHRPPAIVSKTVGELIPVLEESKRKTGRSPRYVTDVVSYLTRFAAFVGETTPVDKVRPETIEAWFDARGEAPSARAANLGRIGSLFTLARRRGYLRDDPITRVERVRIVREEPAILMPEQAERLLRVCREQFPELLAMLSAMMFTGCRPGEAEGMEWGDVRLEESRVIISARITKTRQRRIAPIHGAGVAWLSLTPPEQRTGKLFPSAFVTLRRRRRDLAKAAGIEWVQDITRHTCASALVSVHEDLGKVARWLGNSPRMLQSHYIAVLSEADANRILHITP